MKYFGLMAGILLVPVSSFGQVVINEILYDDTSANDDYEFVEIYNAGPLAVDISGWKLEGVDTNVDSTETVPPTTSLASGDYYVIGKAAVPNVDQIRTTSLENGAAAAPDAVALRDSTNTLIDSVFYERQAGLPVGFLAVGEPVGTGGIWGNNQAVLNPGLNDPATGLPDNGTFSLCRYVDGRDTDNNENDFGLAIATPGTANNSKGSIDLAAPYTDNFDGTENDFSKDLVGNYFSFQIQDPAAADPMPFDSGNPFVIPASPQGGRVGMGWDATGGGNMGIFNLKAPVTNVSVECFVYLATETLGAAAGADEEQWTFPVVRGKADGVYNAEPANGDNGIRWKYRRNGNVITLTLEDYRANVTTVIGGSAITITTGVNDGWQRLYLSVSGANVEGALGGTYGSGIGSGTVRSGTTANLRSGGIGFGYREFSLYVGTAATLGANPVRPITIDRLTVTDLGSSVQGWQLY